MIGSQINQYKILDQLGEGGMGIVYLAEDTRLHRKAALKFISGPTQATVEERKRFNREAQAAARLNHPNICTVYELGENEDQAFIALEYVEGETLKERMRRGNISNEEIRNLLEQIAEGLHAAHEQGVIHRDVKPANIMITGRGHVKIMDFGIAKVSEVETELTRANSTIGTIAYMSPEQARGDKVDHRTDIWALGVILYELTTGKRPFSGAFREAVMYAMMHEQVPAASTINPGIPKDVEHIINKCLQRERDERYGSLKELLVYLKGEVLVAKGSSATELPEYSIGREQPTTIRPYVTDTETGSIWTTFSTWTQIIYKRRPLLSGVMLVMLFVTMTLAFPDLRDSFSGLSTNGSLPASMHMAVLPFDVLGNESNDETFSTGLAHIVATNLLRMNHEKEDLWIIPVREVLSQSVNSASEAREKFGVNLAVSGTIVEFENRTEITLDVTDAQTLRVIGSEVVELNDMSPYNIQVQVIKKLGIMLGLQAPVDSQGNQLEGVTQDPEAYKLYIQGQGFIQRFENLDNIQAAIDLFDKAIQVDSSFAAAYAESSLAYMKKYYFTNDPQAMELASERSNKALSLK